MLGRFLEFSIATPDIQASLDFYGKLGFSELPVGEAWTHPYAAVTDGRVCLGLHGEFIPSPSLTFVKPGLLKHLSEFESLGLGFAFSRLGNEVFNELGFLDPSGQLIRLVEARTFSPSKRSDTDTSLCGYFLEIALPTPDPAAAKAFWERFGFVGWDEPNGPMPHVACTSDSINVGLYDPAHLRVPTLKFDAGDVAGALARLAAACLIAPEGTPLLLLSEEVAATGIIQSDS